MLEQYTKVFEKYGRRLERFKGFYGVGYYHTDLEDYKKGIVDWKWAGRSLRGLEDTIKLIREQS